MPRSGSVSVRAWALWLVAAVTVCGYLLPAHAASDRVVAVGDVHGSFDGLTTILREAGLIDASNRWIGGTATLVQTGDLLDRGVMLREVMDLLMSLQEEARAQGGRVLVLLGNHETMNLLGITRDVNRDAYAEFADESSEQRRAQAWATYVTFWKRRLPELGLPPRISKEAKDQWMVMHPPGFLEYVEALGPKGRYGAWLRDRPAVAIVADTLFVHGGWGPFLDGRSADGVNREVAEELRTFDSTRGWMVDEGLALPWYSVQELTREAQRELDWISQQDPTTVPGGRLQRAAKLELAWSSWLLTHLDGPFWYRGASSWSQEEHSDLVRSLMQGLGAVRQVVGHTPQRTGRIQPRVGGLVYFIDTGMLTEVYGGAPSALEIDGGTITAIYPDERQLLQPSESRSTD